MRLIPYEEYKPTLEIEGAEVAPLEWKVVRSDAVFESSKTQISPEVFAAEDVFHYSIPAIQEHGDGETVEGDSIASAKQLVDHQVLLVSRLNPRKSTICIAAPREQLTLASTELIALTVKACDISFLSYLFESELTRQRLNSLVQSVTRSHQRVEPKHITKFWAAWPEPQLQEQIARFLDVSVGKIDTLVSKKRELIDLLQEKRRALVSRCVTRGLPPDAARAAGLDPQPKLKPSGVDWLGDVPEHWDLKRLKWAITFQRGHDLPADSREEGDVPLVSSSGISATHSEAKSTGPGIVTGRYGTIGNFYFVEDDYWPLNTTLYGIEYFENNVEYLRYLLEPLDVLFLLNANKSAVPGVDRNDIHQLYIALPPKSEQDEILKYIQSHENVIGQLTEKTGEAIDALLEYRSALITAAVTGKIDVREVEV